MKIVKLLFLVLLIISQGNVHAQSKRINSNYKLFREGKLDELEKQINNQIKNKWSEIPKSEKIQIYTDLGKINTIKKNYPLALSALLNAKLLNRGDSVKYEVYNSAFADFFEKIGAYDIAIQYYKKSFNQSSNLLERYFNSSSIAVMFLRINAPDSALVYFEYQKKESLKMKDFIALSSSLNNIGISHLKKNELKIASSIFENALAILDKNKEIKSKNFNNEKATFRNSVHGNLGESYLKEKKYSLAIEFLEKHHQFNIQQKDFPIQPSVGLMLVEAYIRLSKINEAQKIERFFSSKAKLLTIDGKLDLLLMQLEIANFEKNDKKVSVLISSIKDTESIKKIEKSIVFNKMNKLVTQFMLSQATQQINFDKIQKLQLKKTIEIAKRETVTIWILLFSVLFGVLLLFYFIYSKNKNQKKKKVLEKEFLVLQEEKIQFKISTQSNYLTEFAIENQNQKKRSDELLKNLNFLIGLEDKNLKPEINSLISDLKNTQLINKSIADLNLKSENLLMDFKINLLFKHANLTPSDIELCSLIRLNLSNKEIAQYRSLETESVKIYKNRLKKKFNLDINHSLSDYISAI